MAPAFTGDQGDEAMLDRRAGMITTQAVKVSSVPDHLGQHRGKLRAIGVWQEADQSLPKPQIPEAGADVVDSDIAESAGVPVAMDELKQGDIRRAAQSSVGLSALAVLVASGVWFAGSALSGICCWRAAHGGRPEASLRRSVFYVGHSSCRRKPLIPRWRWRSGEHRMYAGNEAACGPDE